MAGTTGNSSKRRTPGISLGGERPPPSPATPEILRAKKVAPVNISTPVPPLPGANMAGYSSSSASRPEVTLEAIAGLLSPIQSGMEKLTTEFNELKISMQEDMAAINRRVAEVESQLNLTNMRFERLDKNTSDANVGNASEQFSQQLNDLQSQVDEIRQRPPTVTHEATHRECTIVLGGLNAFGSKQEAETWLTDKLKCIAARSFVECYAKGDFRGMLFGKFTTTIDREVALVKLHSTPIAHEGQNISSKNPLADRKEGA